jgi:hypothetical protein
VRAVTRIRCDRSEVPAFGSESFEKTARRSQDGSPVMGQKKGAATVPIRAIIAEISSEKGSCVVSSNDHPPGAGRQQAVRRLGRPESPPMTSRYRWLPPGDTAD